MEECLQQLVLTKELPSDEILALQIKLQLLVEKVSHTVWNDGGNTKTAKIHSEVYLKALRNQWQELKDSIPVEHQQNGTMPTKHLVSFPIFQYHAHSIPSLNTSSTL
jgi:hypothetical protein